MSKKPNHKELERRLKEFEESDKLGTKLEKELEEESEEKGYKSNPVQNGQLQDEAVIQRYSRGAKLFSWAKIAAAFVLGAVGWYSVNELSPTEQISTPNHAAKELELEQRIETTKNALNNAVGEVAKYGQENTALQTTNQNLQQTLAAIKEGLQSLKINYNAKDQAQEIGGTIQALKANYEVAAQEQYQKKLENLLNKNNALEKQVARLAVIKVGELAKRLYADPRDQLYTALQNNDKEEVLRLVRQHLKDQPMKEPTKGTTRELYMRMMNIQPDINQEHANLFENILLEIGSKKGKEYIFRLEK